MTHRGASHNRRAGITRPLFWSERDDSALPVDARHVRAPNQEQADVLTSQFRRKSMPLMLAMQLVSSHDYVPLRRQRA